MLASLAALARWLIVAPVVALMAVPAALDWLWWQQTGKTLWPTPHWFVKLVRWARS